MLSLCVFAFVLPAVFVHGMPAKNKKSRKTEEENMKMIRKAALLLALVLLLGRSSM